MKKQNIFFLIPMFVLTALFLMVTGREADAETVTSFINGDHATQTATMAGAMGSARMREIYDKVKAKNPGKTVVPGYLRCEREIKDGLTHYSFNFTRDTGSVTDTEVKLDRSSKFLVSDIGMFLVKTDEAAPNCEVDQTFPNATVFADGVAFKSKFLEVFYKGQLGLKVESTVYHETQPLSDFRAVGAMSQSSETTYSEKTQNMGYIQMTPEIYIKGDQPHELTIDVPVTDAHKVANDVAGMKNKIVVNLIGFLVK